MKPHSRHFQNVCPQDGQISSSNSALLENPQIAHSFTGMALPPMLKLTHSSPAHIDRIQEGVNGNQTLPTSDGQFLSSTLITPGPFFCNLN